MIRLAAALGLASVLSAAAVQGEPDDLELRVTTDVAAVGFGEGFPLTVVRRWARSLEPQTWDDEVLAPLVLRLLDTVRREDGKWMEETRRYRAYLFQNGPVVVPAPWFRARADDGRIRVAFAEDLTFQVSSALTAGEGLGIELPSDVLPAPASWRRIAAAITAVALVLAAATHLLRRQLRARAQAEMPLVPPHVRALARLAELRARTPNGNDAVQAFFVELALIVRSHLDQRFELNAVQSTTDELLAADRTKRSLDQSARTRLAKLLDRSDAVKFARELPDSTEREQCVAAAEALVIATAPPGEEVRS